MRNDCWPCALEYELLRWLLWLPRPPCEDGDCCELEVPVPGSRCAHALAASKVQAMQHTVVRNVFFISISPLVGCFFLADSTRCHYDFTRKGKDNRDPNNGAISPHFLDAKY